MPDQLTLFDLEAPAQAAPAAPRRARAPRDTAPAPAGPPAARAASQAAPARVAPPRAEREAAALASLAAERAPSGRCYLLGAERASLLEIAQTLHEAIGSRVPLVIPAGLAGAVVPFAVAWSKLRGSRPIFTKYSLDVVRNYTQVSHARAAAELDFAPRPLRQTILDTANFVQRPAAH